MADYNFLNDSGLAQTAAPIGYEKQGLFNSGANLLSDIGYIIGIALGLIGIIFFGLIFYGGWLWMTAQGNDDQVSKAKGIIISSSVGLAVTLLAYAISVLIISVLSKGAI